jgi:hypothetical protein
MSLVGGGDSEFFAEGSKGLEIVTAGAHCRLPLKRIEKTRQWIVILNQKHFVVRQELVHGQKFREYLYEHAVSFANFDCASRAAMVESAESESASSQP